MTNIERPDFQPDDRPAGFRSRRARLGDAVGVTRVGASLWELAPGEAAYPYHWHHAEEEIVIVLAGRPSLRTPGGWRELEQGEVAGFPLGEEGAHQVVNRTDETVRFISVSNNAAAEVCIYPDSNKVGTYGELGDFRELFRRDAAADYWDGEAPPSR